MDGEELKQFVPELLQARYPGRSREADPHSGDIVPGGHFGWVLDLDECVVLVRASQTSHPFLLIRGGVAHAIPRSEALATHVAAANKELMVGRLYMGYGEGIALVAFDEAISADYLSLQYEPSIEDAVTRFEMSVQYTSEWAKTIREKYGGRQFSPDDWYLMSI